MPRPLRQRIVRPGLPHHIWFRGNSRRNLFSHPADFLLFLVQLKRSLQANGCRLSALCLLRNHGHLLLEAPGQVELSRCMQVLLQGYSRYRHTRYRSSGRLFEDRFGCRPVRGIRYLAIVTAYIDLNPVRAGLVKRAQDSRWSSCRMHAAEAGTPATLRDLCSPNPWYRSLGHDDLTRAAAYRAWLQECVRYERNRRIWEALDIRARLTHVPSSFRERRPSGSRVR